MAESETHGDPDFLSGGGEMGQLMRQLDWSSTALGAPSEWPQALRTVIRMLLDTRHPMYIFWGPQSICIYNDAYRQSIGPERHPSSLGRPGVEVWAEIWDVIGPPIEHVMSGRGATWYANHLVPITRNGKREDVYWTYSYSPIEDELASNSVGGVLVICTETTAQLQLVAQQERLRVALTAARMVAWELDPDTDTLRVSENAADVFGVPSAAVLEKSGHGFALVHPDDVERHRKIIQTAAAECGSFVSQFRIIRRDTGAVVWVEDRGHGVRRSDGSVRLAGVILDETARREADEKLRESEERFRALADNIPQLAWIAEPGTEGKASWFNQVWLDYTGTTLDQMQGSGWKSVHHPDYIERVAQKFEHHVKHCLDWEDTFPLRRHDGEFRWFLSRMNFIRDETGEAVRIVGTNTDITQERRLEEQLREVPAELSDANRRKDEFIATLAHELRNPLAPIRNGLQLMKLAGGHQETIEKTRAMMDRQLTQMVRLVDDLMDVSRITRGALELRRERIPLAAVLSSAIETCRPIIEQMGHQLVVDIPDQPIIVDADMTRLSQAFANLLNNAAKYTEQSGRIRVDVKVVENEAVVTVQDSGIGLAADELPLIFEMFVQIDRSLERTQGGLGIGLTLVKRLVEMHHGTVEAVSAGRGKGSEFVVRLPIVVETSRPHSTSVGDEPAASTTSLRILIVDDNVDGANSLSGLLKLKGYASRMVYDGQAGVDAALAYRPDVILLDIGLPKLNGYEVCRFIREQSWGKGITIIAITGWGQDEDRVRSKAAGFDHHIVKPVDPQALMKMLEELPDRVAKM